MHTAQEQDIVTRDRVRPGRPSDFVAALAIHRAAFSDTYPNNSRGVTVKLLAQFLIKSNFDERKTLLWEETFKRPGVFVACEQARVVGFIAVAAEPEGHGKVEALYVANEHRGDGMGTELLTAGQDYLRERGCVDVLLTVVPWTRAAKFYHRNGYMPTGRPVEGPMLAPGIELEQLELSRSLND